MMEELELRPQDVPPEPQQDTGHAPPQTISIEEWMLSGEPAVEEKPQPEQLADAQLLAVLEACIYVAEEPLMPAQIAAALNQDEERIRALIQRLVAEFDRPEHGVSIKEVAGGYKMATKPEHHEAVRNFVKSLKAPLKLSLPALETLAVIAYKQPVTTPEILEIRGVQGGGVLKTLLDRKLIAEAGRKNVIGKPILFKTTKEFLVQFGLKDLSELPSLKEFEEIRRMAMGDSEILPGPPAAERASMATPESQAAAVAEIPHPETEAASEPQVSAAAAEAAAAELQPSDAEEEAAEPQSSGPEAEAAERQPSDAEPEAVVRESAESRSQAPASGAEAGAPESPASQPEEAPPNPMTPADSQDN